MTELDWQASTDPLPMIEMRRGRSSDRKLRLFACAVTRALPPADDEVEGRKREVSVQVAERFADGRATAEALAAVLPCTRGKGYFWSVALPSAWAGRNGPSG